MQHRAEGFRGQVMHVVPRPLLAAAAAHLLAAELYPTDIGFYPRAWRHYRERPDGAPEHILIFCTAGRGWFEVDGREGFLEPDQALLIPQGRPHRYGADARQPWTIHWAHFAGEDAAYFSGLLPVGCPLVPVAAATRPALVRLFRECCAALANGFSPTRILYAAQVLRHLLAALFFDNPAFTAGAWPRPARDFRRVFDYMRQQLPNRLTLAQMARAAGLSAPRFSALFKAQTGVTPGDYYLRRRLQIASRLLDTTDQSIKEIAAACGYDDPYYFSRLFRKVMGVPPTVYRRTQKG